MAEKNVYTAHEMRSYADHLYEDGVNYFVRNGLQTYLIEMLRQAADNTEELDNLRKATKVEVHFDGSEVNAKLALRCEELRLRLEEIKKIAQRENWRDEKDQGVRINTCAKVHNVVMKDILRAANGENVSK